MRAPELLSIIVPVYNEADTIGRVIRRLLTIDLPIPREIIAINDGSRDRTREALEGLRGISPMLTIVHADHNRGKGHAVRTGIARAQGSIIAIQDADLELDPADLAVLVEPILKGEVQVVYGSRFLGRSTHVPTMTRTANRVLTIVTNVLFGSSLTDMETCYKVMRIDVARQLPLTANRFDIEPDITATLLLSGHRIVERSVTFSPRSRTAGKKVGWRDGLAAIGVLVRHRLRRHPPRNAMRGQ
jgi:glycosyltransferase involved in cell wall biosynthesis